MSHDFYTSILNKCDAPEALEFLNRDCKLLPQKQNALSILVLDFVKAQDLKNYVEYLSTFLKMDLKYWRAIADRVEVELQALNGLKHNRSEYSWLRLVEKMDYEESLRRHFTPRTLQIDRKDYLAPLYGCYESNLHKAAVVLLPDSGFDASIVPAQKRRGKAIKFLFHSNQCVQTEWTIISEHDKFFVVLSDGGARFALNWNATLQAFDLKFRENEILQRRTPCVLQYKPKSRPSYRTILNNIDAFKSRFMKISSRKSYKIEYKGNQFEYVHLLDTFLINQDPDWTTQEEISENHETSQKTYAMAAKVKKTKETVAFTPNAVEEMKHHRRVAFSKQHSRRESIVNLQDVKKHKRKPRHSRKKRKTSRHYRRKALFY